MSNTSATKTFGTSGHNHIMNPGCDESLSKIHGILVSMERLGTCMKVYDDVKNEQGYNKFQTLYFSV